MGSGCAPRSLIPTSPKPCGACSRSGARGSSSTSWEGDFYNLTNKTLNEYVKVYLGDEFSAKDFRTWGGTLLAAIYLAGARGKEGFPESESEQKRSVTAVMRRVAERLGNTPAVTRESYVSPAVVEQYLDGRTIDDFRPRHLRFVKARDVGLSPEEQACSVCCVRANSTCTRGCLARSSFCRFPGIVPLRTLRRRTTVARKRCSSATVAVTRSKRLKARDASDVHRRTPGRSRPDLCDTCAGRTPGRAVARRAASRSPQPRAEPS
jgi:hypothetical protein